MVVNPSHGIESLKNHLKLQQIQETDKDNFYLPSQALFFMVIYPWDRIRKKPSSRKKHSLVPVAHFKRWAFFMVLESIKNHLTKNRETSYMDDIRCIIESSKTKRLNYK